MNKLSAGVERLAPWHMDIRLTDGLTTGEVFSGTEIIDKEQNEGVSLLSMREPFLNQLDVIYPDGLGGKTFLDCSCNAGGYCFWVRERDIRYALGIDVREHWIRQARFVQDHRTVAATDRIEFQVGNLYDLPQMELDPFDITIFKGIFDHLPDPVTGLKGVADLTSELMILNSYMAWGEEDGYLRIATESKTHPMSGVYGLNWHPTGPRVLADILHWAGFVESKLRFMRQSRVDPRFGVAEIFATKTAGLLDNFAGDTLRSSE